MHRNPQLPHLHATPITQRCSCREGKCSVQAVPGMRAGCGCRAAHGRHAAGAREEQQLPRRRAADNSGAGRCRRRTLSSPSLPVPAYTACDRHCWGTSILDPWRPHGPSGSCRGSLSACQQRWEASTPQPTARLVTRPVQCRTRSSRHRLDSQACSIAVKLPACQHGSPSDDTGGTACPSRWHATTSLAGGSMHPYAF